jgi:hypothetical protein
MFFRLGVDSLDIRTPISYPYPQRKEIVQAKERSASGITHIESFDVTTTTRSYSYEDLPTDEFQALVNWFENVANGMENVFEVTDDLGEQFDARFTSPILDFNLTGHDLWGGSFALEIQ